ncbi:hypothetical protein Pfo_016306 [Paulownia fortunei]|nr:hypothetical protein Pfo_016306 [Paulownia fortunei]
MAKTSTKSHVLLPLILFLSLLILPTSLEVSSPSKDKILPHMKNYMMMRQLHQRETTLNNPHSTSASPAAAASSSSTKTSKENQELFHAAAHEVPSGPNPESN